MELEVTLVVAGWAGIDEDYRNREQALDCIKDVVLENRGSDFILFPGGFVSDICEMDDVLTDISEICDDYDGMLMTGFDSARKTPRDMYFCIVEAGGVLSSFMQAAITSDDILNRSAAQENRLFKHRGVTVGVTCCGEIFHEGLRKEVFGERGERRPELLFNCVHAGANFRHGKLWRLLDAYSRSAGFYTYHVKSLYQHNLKTLSGARQHDSKLYEDLNIGTLHYTVDPHKRHWFVPPKEEWLDK